MRMRVCTVPLSPEPLLFTPVNTGSSRNSPESHFTLSVWCFSCIEVHAFYFISITTHEHTITLCCGAQKTVSLRQIIWATKTPLKWYTVARRFSNNIFMIYISRIQYTGSKPWIIICAVWSSVHESDNFDNIVMAEKKDYCTEQSFTILICSAKILTKRPMSKLVI